jgi:nicotinate-nucleotide--dimethylbenzimidazole phosphoribosyltransferase
MRFFLVAHDRSSGSVRMVSEQTFDTRQEALDSLGSAPGDASFDAVDLFVVDLETVTPVVVMRAAIPVAAPLADAWAVSEDALLEPGAPAGLLEPMEAEEGAGLAGSDDTELASALRRAASQMEESGIAPAPTVEEVLAAQNGPLEAEAVEIAGAVPEEEATAEEEAAPPEEPADVPVEAVEEPAAVEEPVAVALPDEPAEQGADDLAAELEAMAGAAVLVDYGVPPADEVSDAVQAGDVPDVAEAPMPVEPPLSDDLAAVLEPAAGAETVWPWEAAPAEAPVAEAGLPPIAEPMGVASAAELEAVEPAAPEAAEPEAVEPAIAESWQPAEAAETSPEAPDCGDSMIPSNGIDFTPRPVIMGDYGDPYADAAATMTAAEPVETGATSAEMPSVEPVDEAIEAVPGEPVAADGPAPVGLEELGIPSEWLESPAAQATIVPEGDLAEPIEAPMAPATASDETKVYEPEPIKLDAYTCDDCVYVGTCPKAGQDGPATCGSFQWKSV